MRLPLLFRAPTFQLAAAAAVMVTGAWLVAWWMVGVVLMVAGLLTGLDVVLRQQPTQRRPSVPHTHEDILERYRQAR